MLNTIMKKKLIENDCVCVVSLIIDDSTFYLSLSLLFMSSSHKHLICCCCPTRVEVKGTFKTIGFATIHKFTPHARDTITAKKTRVCIKCYVKYTRPAKKR